MFENKAVIPVYLNTTVVKSLFTIIVAIYGKEKTTTDKQVVTINAKIPMSEVSYNILGKYVQGDLNIQTVKDCSKQNSEETIFMDIQILKELKNMLEHNILLKQINTSKELQKIKENDFVEFTCKMRENPVLEKAKETMNILEMEGLFEDVAIENHDNSKIYQGGDRIKILNFFKQGIENCKKNNCIRYISDYIENTSIRAIIPIEGKNMMVNTEYMMDGKVRVFGKVIKVCKEKNGMDMNVLSGTCLDYINYDYFKPNNSKMFNFTQKDKSSNMISENIKCDFIEVIPIAIYI